MYNMHEIAGPATLALERCKKRQRVEEKTSERSDPFSFDDVFNDIAHAQGYEAFPAIAWNTDDEDEHDNASTTLSLQKEMDDLASANHGMKRTRSSCRCLIRSIAFTEDLVKLESETPSNLLELPFFAQTSSHQKLECLASAIHNVAQSVNSANDVSPISSQALLSPQTPLKQLKKVDLAIHIDTVRNSDAAVLSAVSSSALAYGENER